MTRVTKATLPGTLRLTIAALLSLSLAVLITSCGSRTSWPEGEPVSLPPLGSGTIPFCVFKGHFSSLDEATEVIFKGTVMNFEPRAMGYTNAEATKYMMDDGGFRSYETNWRDYESYICYKGGEITDRVTFAGDATVIIEIIPGIGWYRIR